MTLAIIQARMGSTRLPSKVLKDLAGKTVLEHVIERVRTCKLINEVIVATTINRVDLEIVRFCAQQGIRVFVGAEDDVLDRYYQAARLIAPSNVVRITSDCPMIDPEIIDQIIALHLDGRFDYTSNTLEETFPDGLDAEVLTFETLATAWREATLKSEREHVTPYIKNHPSEFKLKSFRNERNLSSMRWTIDQPEDYRFLSELFRRIYLKKSSFRMADVLKELEKDPALLKLNSGIIRNEGYLKSLTKDK